MKQLLDSLSILLKPLGFTKRGDFFTKRWPNGNIGFVCVYKRGPARNISDSFSVTAEFAVASKVCLERFQTFLAYPDNEKPHPSCTHSAERIGYLNGKGCDYWWELDPVNFAKSESEIRSGVVDFGLPFIEAEISDEAICARRLSGFLENGDDISPAELCILAFLLHRLEDTSSFKIVADRGFEKLGSLPFENMTIAEFLCELGFHPTETCPPPTSERNPYLYLADQLRPRKKFPDRS